MDRNLWWGVRKAVGSLVALRKESVDRNGGLMSVVRFASVALRKESVDRNRKINTRGSEKMKSLSARRAWIEMPTLC